MKLSPLQLEGYFLTELSFQADPAHDPGKPIQFHEHDLAVEPTTTPLSDQERRWQVTLKIRLQPRRESNSPYFLSLSLVGVVWAAPQIPADRLESLIRTNGPSMLYGAAREMVRDLTARGPYPALSLPSVSFLNEAAEGGEARSTAPGDRFAATSEPASEG